MDNVTELNLPTPNLRCACGEEWWTTRGITVDRNGHVGGWVEPLTCVSCGLGAPRFFF